MNINSISRRLRTCAIIIVVTFVGSLCARAENVVTIPHIIYISPGGDTSADGTLERPYGDIAMALRSARNIPGDIEIRLRKGIYRLEKPLILTPEDGRQDRHVTIAPCPGEKPVLTSSLPVKLRWQPYRNGIMKAHVEGQPVMDMLIVDGEIRHMARYPNYDPEAVRFNGTSSDATSPKRVKGWKNPAGGYLHAMHASDWGDFHYRITGKTKKGELQLEGGWQNNRPSPLHKENRMVENIFEELDAPGEWFYDEKTSTLYYYPLPGENIEDATFESPQLKSLVEFRGSTDNPVRNITLSGLELTGTVRTFMESYEPLLRSDWTVYRGGAIYLEGTENCSVDNSYFHNLGGNGIFFSGYNRGDEVTGSHLTNIGASAICFVGKPEAVRSPSFQYGQSVPYEEIDHTPGPKSDDYPAQCRVYDNLIHTIGLFEKQITGVELSMSKDITIAHNSIYDTPRAGINIGDGTWGGHVIEFNDVFYTVKETGDHGSFNSWGRDRFWHPNRGVMNEIAAKDRALILADATATTIIRNNRFRCDRGWDIDLDDGSSNYHIYNNLCLNGGIKLREGFCRVVENNIMVSNSFHPHVWFPESGDIFTRNIVMTAYKPIAIDHWGAMVDYNVFPDSASLYESKQRGTDTHSIVAALNPNNSYYGDFSLGNDSEPIKTGLFHNFPMDRFGVVSPGLKTLAERPVMPLITSSGQVKSDNEIMDWNGLSLKNLTTLGERSATGMDSERGVYVVSVAALGSPFRDFIRPNDVIIGAGDSQVNNLDDLKKALNAIDSTNDFPVVIFRNQKENRILLPGVPKK